MKNPDAFDPPEYYTIDVPKFRDPMEKMRVSGGGCGFNHWIIPSDKPHSCRPLLERMGYFLKREQKYDSPTYSAEECSSNRFGHLFGQMYGVGVSRAIGGACFSYENWSNAPASYCLEWVWIHPYFRRNSILTGAWSHFQKRHGDFMPMPPYSRAMLAFLKKIGHPSGKTSWEEWERVAGYL